MCGMDGLNVIVALPFIILKEGIEQLPELCHPRLTACLGCAWGLSCRYKFSRLGRVASGSADFFIA